MKIWKNYRVHNLIGHPMSQIFYDIGLHRISEWFHDSTLPEEEK